MFVRISLRQMEGEKNKEKHLALVSVFAGYRCLNQGVQNYSEDLNYSYV